MAGHGVRPACPANRLPLAPNNTRVGDVRCADCGEAYELKAGQGAIAWGAAALILLPLREKVAGPAQPGLTDEGSTGPQGSSAAVHR